MVTIRNPDKTSFFRLTFYLLSDLVSSECGLASVGIALRVRTQRALLDYLKFIFTLLQLAPAG